MMNRTAQTAQDLASKGRYGDSMLVHMNPKEVAGIASLAPGQMTINPETGLPEAFSFSKLFNRVAPIAIPIALGAATGGIGAGAAGGAGTTAGTAAGTGIFSNPLVKKSIFNALTSTALAKMRGAETDDALNAGMVTGLTYAGGAKLLDVGAPDITQTEIGLQNAANADGLTADPITQMDVTKTIMPDITTASYQNPASYTPFTEFDPSRAFEKDLVPPTTGLKMGDSINQVGFKPQGGLVIDDPLSRGEVEKIDIVNKGSGAASDRNYVLRERQDPSGGISGYLKSVAPTDLKDTALMAGSIYTGQAMAPTPQEEEERKRRQIAMTAPYQRNVSFPDEYRGREYRYFQEGGVVDPTSPVEDTPEGMGLEYYAPFIAGYGADTSIPNTSVYPTPPTSPLSPPIGGGVTSGSVERVYNLPTTDTKAPEVTDADLLQELRKLRAPEGYLWSRKIDSDYRGGSGGDISYRLTPISNLSRKELMDLTRRGNLTRYRPQGSMFSDRMPQVGITAGTEGGKFGKPLDTYDPRMRRQIVDRMFMQEGGITSLPQTEGQVDGRGDGMEDQVFGDIEGEQEVALSKDEFIVPADVVAGLGNGSSNAGASQLYEMMDRVRMARTGKKEQPPEINAEDFLPA